MKKLLLLVIAVLGFTMANARDTYSHDIKDLPSAAQTILKNNFKAGVSHIKIDKDFGRVKEYDVVLTNGAEISFDHDGNWKDIEMSSNESVPAKFILAPIAQYVKNNHKGAKITGIEKNRSGYEVEISGGIDIKFNSKGEFLKYD